MSVWANETIVHTQPEVRLLAGWLLEYWNTTSLSNEKPLDVGGGMVRDKIELGNVKLLSSFVHYLCNFSSLFSRDLFLGSGLDYLTVIINENSYDAALRIVANVIPMFFSCPEKLTQEARCVSEYKTVISLSIERLIANGTWLWLKVQSVKVAVLLY